MWLFCAKVCSISLTGSRWNNGRRLALLQQKSRSPFIEIQFIENLLMSQSFLLFSLLLFSLFLFSFFSAVFLHLVSSLPPQRWNWLLICRSSGSSSSCLLVLYLVTWLCCPTAADVTSCLVCVLVPGSPPGELRRFPWELQQELRAQRTLALLC